MTLSKGVSNFIAKELETLPDFNNKAQLLVNAYDLLEHVRELEKNFKELKERLIK